MKLERKTEALDRSFESVRASIAKTLLERDKKATELERVGAEILAKIKSGASISSDLAKYKLTWQSTGEFATKASYIPTLGSVDEQIKEEILSLKQVGDVYGSTVNIKDDKYIVRLKAKVNPDYSKLADKQKKEFSDRYAAGDASFEMDAVKKITKKKLEKSGAIWINPAILQLDERSATPENSNDE
jgi:hypothetical protein